MSKQFSKSIFVYEHATRFMTQISDDIYELQSYNSLVVRNDLWSFRNGFPSEWFVIRHELVDLKKAREVKATPPTCRMSPSLCAYKNKHIFVLGGYNP